MSPPGAVVKGSTVDLVCEATYLGTSISFSWTGSNGVGLLSNNTDGTIAVTFSTDGDYGIYTCTGSNEFGNGYATIEVIQGKLNGYSHAFMYLCSTNPGNDYKA